MTGLNGAINLDKPAGISSAMAVAKVKRLLPRGTKIGHAGTLDPFATGVLLLLVGRATKWCERLMDQPKQYEATVKFGATTATDDPESPEERGVERVIPGEEIASLLPRFIGEIQQQPPAYSAMKIAGRRAYELARKGHELEMKPRPVRVYSIEIIDYTWPLLRLRIDCGRGTYIRSLARDLGGELKVGGYLTQLRRTRVGSFGIASAVTLAQLTAETIGEHLQTL